MLVAIQYAEKMLACCLDLYLIFYMHRKLDKIAAVNSAELQCKDFCCRLFLVRPECLLSIINKL